MEKAEISVKPEAVSGWVSITARYFSKCASCDKWVQPGQPVIFNPAEHIVVHPDCPIPEQTNPPEFMGTRAKLVRNATPAEIRFKSYLNELGIRYHFQEGFILRVVLDHKFRIVDFYIPKAGLIFEIDGKHHQRKRKQDIIRENEIRDRCEGLLIMRFSNDEVLNEPDKVKAKVLKIFKKRCITDWQRPRQSAWEPAPQEDKSIRSALRSNALTRRY